MLFSQLSSVCFIKVPPQARADSSLGEASYRTQLTGLM
jgi:hypothetical protein